MPARPFRFALHAAALCAAILFSGLSAAFCGAQAKPLLLNGPVLRIVYTAESAGYLHPCPT